MQLRMQRACNNHPGQCNSEHDADSGEVAQVTAHEPRYRWLVTRRGAASLEVCFLPKLTLTDVLGRYPGASADPLPDTPNPAPGLPVA